MASEAKALRKGMSSDCVSVTGYGPKAAAAFAQKSASRAKKSQIAIVGFGGSVSKDLKGGSVVVASEVYGPETSKAGKPSSPRSNDPDLKTHTSISLNPSLNSGLHDYLSDEMKAPSIVYGPIASSDHISWRGKEQRQLNEKGILAVEMEAWWMLKELDENTRSRVSVVRVILDSPSVRQKPWLLPKNFRQARKQLAVLGKILEDHLKTA